VTPTVAVSINSTDVNLAHSTATVSFAFSEAPTAFTLADTSAVGGMLSGLQQVDATDYTAIFTAAANTDISNASVSVVSGSWQEANGNPGLGGSTGTFVVDTVTPTIESVTSQQGTFQTGSVIDIVFTMNEATSVSGGTPTLTLNDGGIAFFDAAHSTPTSLVFDYTVGAHDTSSALAITALNTNGATFQDPAGNVANLAAAKAQLPGTFVNVSPNGNDTLTTGADATVNLGNGNDTVTAGADSTVKLGNGNDKVTAGDDSTISLGNGNDLVFTGANSTVTAGNGNHTVTAGTGSTISLGDGNHTVTAGDGSTISLGNGNDVVYAGANTSIMFGSGNNTVFAGASDTITLGKGNELVAFGVNPSPLTIGNEVVNGFAKGDTLEFNHALVGNFSTLMSDARQMGADTVITLDQHDSVTLKGVAVTSISSSSVKFT
jgi:hypothetical protein